MPYCVDTSGWLDGWQRQYPPDVFPTLWTKIDALISAGEIISSEEVYFELERKSDDLHAWIMKQIRCINFLQMIRELKLTF